MNKLLVSLIVVALMCVAGWTVRAELTRTAPAPQMWEYETVYEYAGPGNQTKLNERGTQSWELVTVVCQKGTDLPCVFYLKRPR